jgi:hypothetical protein
MDFEEYLKSKKIDSAAFQRAESALWQEWKGLFEKINPVSFTAQKLYLINPIRRKYKLISSPSETSASAPSKPKPVFKPKIS